MPIVFNRGVELLGTLDELPDQEAIRHLPQFFRADLDMVHRLGGPFLRRFLRAAPASSARYTVVDTKVHMLMPGWHACIPGWHCDDFHRPGGGQPDLEGMADVRSSHVCVAVGPTALPEFVAEPMTLPAPAQLGDRDRPLYARYHELIEELRPRTVRPASGQLVRFDCFDFHRGRPAEERAWRFFARLTQSDHLAPRNEVRTQTQVYLTAPFEQW